MEPNARCANKKFKKGKKKYNKTVSSLCLANPTFELKSGLKCYYYVMQLSFRKHRPVPGGFRCAASHSFTANSLRSGSTLLLFENPRWFKPKEPIPWLLLGFKILESFRCPRNQTSQKPESYKKHNPR